MFQIYSPKTNKKLYTSAKYLQSKNPEKYIN